MFSEPETLWKEACKYFQWCDDNPLEEVDYKGGMAKKVVMKRMRAYTLKGLCLFLGVNSGYFVDFENGLTDSESDKEFSLILTRIKDVIYTQKFTGAAANMLNQNIIARDLGLTEKSETRAENVNLNIEPSQEEAARIAAAILKDI